MLEMFKGVANSPETTITNDVSNTDTLIYVLDDTRVPEELPNLMVLGTGVSAETIKVLSIEGNVITVERGFQGTPRAWNAGTVIARNFTEYDYNALMENIKELKGSTDTNASDILDLMSYVGDLENLDTAEKSNIVLALNEIYQDLAAHKAESASKLRRIEFNCTPESGLIINDQQSYVINKIAYLYVAVRKVDGTEFDVGATSVFTIPHAPSAGVIGLDGIGMTSGGTSKLLNNINLQKWNKKVNCFVAEANTFTIYITGSYLID